MLVDGGYSRCFSQYLLAFIIRAKLLGKNERETTGLYACFSSLFKYKINLKSINLLLTKNVQTTGLLTYHTARTSTYKLEWPFATE